MTGGNPRTRCLTRGGRLNIQSRQGARGSGYLLLRNKPHGNAVPLNSDIYCAHQSAIWAWGAAHLRSTQHQLMVSKRLAHAHLAATTPAGAVTGHLQVSSPWLVHGTQPTMEAMVSFHRHKYLHSASTQRPIYIALPEKCLHQSPQFCKELSTFGTFVSLREPIFSKWPTHTVRKLHRSIISIQRLKSKNMYMVSYSLLQLTFKKRPRLALMQSQRIFSLLCKAGFFFMYLNPNNVPPTDWT